jgi:hypothetical protein
MRRRRRRARKKYWSGGVYSRIRTTVDILYMTKAELSADGVSSIWLAAQGGHAKCIVGLIKLGADVNQAANNRATPLYIAARNGKHECVLHALFLGWTILHHKPRMRNVFAGARTQLDSGCTWI